MAKAKTDEKVMAMVETELEKNPDVSVDELQEKGTAINKEVASLTARQFHARYPLQVKRRKAIGGTKAAAPKKKAKRAPGKKRAAPSKARKEAKPAAAAPDAPAVDRRGVRDAFLKFASALAAAEQRKDLVNVLADVDKYVDRAVKAAGR